MRLNAKLQKYPGPTDRGTIVWDSDTGEVGGELAAEVLEGIREAEQRGYIPCGPQFQEEIPAGDPRHTPTEFAAVICYLGYELPAELAAEFKLPDFPDPLEGMTAAERGRTVF